MEEGAVNIYESIQEVLWRIRKRLLRPVQRPLINEFEADKEKFIEYLMSSGIMQSNSLCKLAYISIFESYIQLQKHSSLKQQQLQRSRLFKNDSKIQNELKSIIREHVERRVDKALDSASKNIRYLLDYHAILEGKNINLHENDANKSEGRLKSFDKPNEQGYLELFDQFKEFIEEYFDKYRTHNIKSWFAQDSIVFDDPIKQDEFYFIITFPEEYIFQKLREYNLQKLHTCDQKDQYDLFVNLQMFLQDYSNNNANKENILAHINQNEETQSRPIALSKNNSMIRNAQMVSSFANQQNLQNQRSFYQPNSIQLEKNEPI